MPTLRDLENWLQEHRAADRVWFAKRLSANDTLANKSNQAGPYFPKPFIFSIFPSLQDSRLLNPRVPLEVCIDSHFDVKRVTAIYYNNKVLGLGTRNEARITNWGGASSALLDPDNTGALAVFVFVKESGRDASKCHVWVCDDAAGTQADLVEDLLGPVEPGKSITWTLDASTSTLETSTQGPCSCALTRDQIPPHWLETFPSGEAIIQKAIELRPDLQHDVDTRLISRRACEYDVFRSVECAFYQPIISQRFQKLDDFLSVAQSILQSRKSRSGRSLELHIRAILQEENLVQNKHFSHQAISEDNKRPDFIFPSVTAYNDPSFPNDRLRMLAVKTTCKDRWRQVINEANRVREKHLLTLQEGVSESQFQEMRSEKVVLVVPQSLHSKYPSAVRSHLVTLESFMADVRHLSL